MAFLGRKETTTQEHLDIEDVRDDLVVLKNGNVSLVMETTSLNFDLLSEEEQDIRILAFAGLMNSLNFPVQIVVRTERTDVTDYVDKLKIYKEKQISLALKRQIEIYMQFIKNLTVNTEVLDKRFFVVIPGIISSIQRTSAVRQIFGKPVKIKNIEEVLEKAKLLLYPKRDHLLKQFQKMGIIAEQLKTDDLIRLYYGIYQPDTPGIKKLILKKQDFSTGIVETLKEE
ncbi:hypothetical protein JW796_03245 [Candidatus Dojkabacteria bacterium]|nr:hypothetical protein [Candidatus Dojkabacteria bacterium]